MAYCATSDIQSEFKAITFSTTTTVTSAEVSAFCDQASSLIDNYVSVRYEVPVTAASALLFLKMIAIWLVKSRVLSILSVKTPQSSTVQDPDGQKLYDQALELLKAIRDGKIPLVGADPASSFGGMSSFLMNENVVYEYKTGEDDW